MLFNKLSWARSAGIQRLDNLSHRQQWSVYGKSHCLKQSALFAHRYITVEILVTSSGPLLSSPSWPPFSLIGNFAFMAFFSQEEERSSSGMLHKGFLDGGSGGWFEQQSTDYTCAGPRHTAQTENMQGQSTDYTCAGPRQPSID